ncbi:MAG: thiamine phosphate synthase [Eubacteriales bacterium]
MLYLITNRKLIKQSDLYTVVKESVIGGVDVVILREKDLLTKELLEVATELKKITDYYNSKLIINNDIDIAKEINCFGFHIGVNQLNKVEDSLLDYKGKVGVSVHNLDEVALAKKFQPDYLLASHIFTTDCKKGLKPKGLKLIEDIKKITDIPIIGLGGINEKNAKDVLLYGAKGIAVMSYIMASDKPYNSAKKIKESYKA